MAEEIKNTNIKKDNIVRPTNESVVTPQPKKVEVDIAPKNEVIQPVVQTTTLEVKPTQSEEITNEEAKKKFLELVKNNKNDDNKSLAEKGRELLGLSSMASLMGDSDFIKDFQEVQKTQIIDDLKQQGKIDAIKSAARKQENRNIRNKAFYDAFKPFFTNFMGIKEPFGLIPMCITVLIFYAPYILLSLILTIIEYTFTGINKIFAAISDFKKPAKALCLTVLWIAFTIAICLGLLYGAQWLFKFKIL